GEDVTLRHWFAGLAVAMLLLGGQQPLFGNDTKKEVATFGALDASSVEAARASALAWMRQTGKTDEATLRQFEILWKQADRSILDRVADSLALGDAAAAKLLAEANDPQAPAPTAIPEILQDAKRPLFYRANLALAYARALS